MSNAIQFLEELGRSPSCSPLLAEQYLATVSELAVDDEQRLALQHRDHSALSTLLDGRVGMFCVICTPDEESEPESLPDDDGDGDAVPDDERPPLQE
jgi:hypothetical protein